LSAVSRPDRLPAVNAHESGIAGRESASGASEGSKANGWNWREIFAKAAYRTGALGLLGRISHRYELRSRAGRTLPVLRRVTQPKYLILCYHRVGTEGIPYYCKLPTAQFEMQMRILRENFRVLSLGQLCQELENPDGRGQAVAVTFDDGYSDLYTHALPVLRKYEIPATVYLTADCIETGDVAWYDRIFLALQVAQGAALDLPLLGERRVVLGSPQQRIAIATQIVSALRRTPAAERQRFCVTLEQQVKLPGEMLSGRMLSWPQIREMRSAGIFFGSHTLSHPVLSMLDAEDVERELRESKSILEARLGEPVLDFAFPFGRPEDYGPIAHAEVARCGYRSAVTTTWGINMPGADMHALRRVQLGEEQTAAMFCLQLHQAFFRADETSAPLDPSSLHSGDAKRVYEDGGALPQRSPDA
jgi:peptidoglycan/xylan/chitin deacetylase (PgdA/CDA1 family)